MLNQPVNTAVQAMADEDRVSVSVTVNGVAYERAVSPRLLLSDFLRHELRLTGTHVGCEHGVCGCCTIRIDGETARAFVTAARHVIDALLFEAARVEETRTPEVRDYENVGLSRATPAGGWLSHEELRQTTQKMAEAVAAEKWADGVAFAIQLLARLAG